MTVRPEHVLQRIAEYEFDFYERLVNAPTFIDPDELESETIIEYGLENYLYIIREYYFVIEKYRTPIH